MCVYTSISNSSPKSSRRPRCPNFTSTSGVLPRQAKIKHVNFPAVEWKSPHGKITLQKKDKHFSFESNYLNTYRFNIPM